MSFYQKSVWLVKGLREFTKSGYEAAQKNFNPEDMKVDAGDKHFMITGANSGIGKATVMFIAKCGGTIHMVCRNKDRADAAKEEVVLSTGNQNIHIHILDMSDPHSVWKFAAEYVNSGRPLDVLVNNAGAMINERKVNNEGLELNFVTNTLATYILTVAMLPVLRKSSQPRAIMVTSGGMLTQKLNVSDLQSERMRPFDGTDVYAQNKRHQVVMTEELSKKYPDVHFSCMHPGWADTPAVRNAMPNFHRRMGSRLRTAEQGADTLSWLCLAKYVSDLKSGEYFQDRQIVPRHLPFACTKVSQEDHAKLMTTLEKIADTYNKE